MAGIKEEAMLKVLELQHTQRLPPNGTPICEREAARKYHIPLTVIHNWVRKGYVKTIQTPERRGQRRLIDERDVAYLAELYPFGKWQVSRIMTILSRLD